jgi:hypothetical protein
MPPRQELETTSVFWTGKSKTCPEAEQDYLAPPKYFGLERFLM